MAYSNYYIQQQIFDLSFYSVANASELQDKVSNIFNNDLLSRMQLLFDKVIPVTSVIKIDQLQLNLTPIGYDNIHRDFADAVIEALEAELMNLIAEGAGITKNPGISNQPIHADYITAITYFISHGVLPLWVQGTQLTDINEIAGHVLNQRAPEFRQLLYTLGQNTSVQKRLANQFSLTVIKGMIGLLETTQAEFIFNYHDYIVKTNERNNTIKTESKTFQAALWEFIFRVLLTESAGRFNRKMFIRNTVVSTAAYFNMDYRQLLKLLNQEKAVRQLIERDAEIIILLNELWAEQRGKVEEEHIITPENTGKQLPLNENTSLLYHYIRYRSIPASSAIRDNKALKDLFAQLLRQTPQNVILIFRSLNFIENIGSRIVEVFDTEDTAHIVRLLEPAYADEIIDYQASVKAINHHTAFIKTDYSQFEKVVWALIIDYLLVDSGSDFSSRRFLESNIRRIANHYNLNLQAFLQVLRGGSDMIKNVNRLNLFLDVIDYIFKEPANKPDEISNNIPETEDTGAAEINQQLIDGLYFWLKNGSMPWWALSANRLPKDIFDTVAGISFNQALRFLAFAGSHEEFKKRVLANIPQAYLLSVLKNLPDGNKAVAVLFSLQMLLKAAHKTTNKDHEQVMLSIFWANFAAGRYQSFDFETFFEKAIAELAMITNLAPVALLRLLVKEADTDKKYQNLKSYINNVTVHGIALLSGTMSMPLTQGSYELPVQLTLQHPDKPEFATEEYFIRLYAILEYFLTNNKLPAGIYVPVNQTGLLIRQLLLALHKNRPLLLTRLFNTETDPVARIFIHNLFAAGLSAEVNLVKDFLNVYIEKDILLFVKHIVQQGGSNPAEISGLWDVIFQHGNSLSAIKIFGRLMQQHSIAAYAAQTFIDEQYFWLVEKSGGLLGADTVAFVKNMNSLFSSVTETHQNSSLNVILRQFNLSVLFTANISLTPDKYIRQFINYSKAYFKGLSLIQLKALLLLITNKTGYTNPFLLILPTLENFVQVLIDEIEKPFIPGKDTLLKPYPLINTELTASQADEFLLPRQEAVIESLVINETDTFFVNNAGLVILHPFLTTYFNRLDMLADGIFKNQEMQLRAVHLLQYLVDSSSDNPEPELLLNKILAGLPLDMPVAAEIILTENEKELSGGLIKAVTQQWEKMKNSSIKGFQHSFLQRQGVMSQIEGNWRLRVEPRAYDLIMQTLPWGIGYIKTKWMEQALTVEWDTP